MAPHFNFLECIIYYMIEINLFKLTILIYLTNKMILKE